MSDPLLTDAIIALAGRVIAENAALGRTVALAESCTGGLVAAALTEIPGSSKVFDRGFVTYSNESKLDMLGVAADLIDTFGAVSVAVAWSMAVGTLRLSRADVALALTGIAGPEGGTAQKPVGTVFFAKICRDDPPDEINTELREFDCDLGRGAIRHQATLVALGLLLP